MFSTTILVAESPLSVNDRPPPDTRPGPKIGYRDRIVESPTKKIKKSISRTSRHVSVPWDERPCLGGNLKRGGLLFLTYGRAGKRRLVRGNSRGRGQRPSNRFVLNRR